MRGAMRLKNFESARSHKGDLYSLSRILTGQQICEMTSA